MQAAATMAISGRERWRASMKFSRMCGPRGQSGRSGVEPTALQALQRTSRVVPSFLLLPPRLPISRAAASSAEESLMSIPQEGGGPVESRDDLVEYLASGCKPKADWRIGTEHEKFGYCTDSMRPIPYDGPRSVRAVLEALAERFGWEPVTEGGHIIGLTRDGANVSLEPGGQLELSGAPLETIHETCDEVNEHLAQVKSVADELGVGFIGLGA